MTGEGMNGTSGYHGNGADDPSRPQLQIWDEEERETAVRSLDDENERWQVLVIIEPVGGDLVRGRISFRSGDRRYDTAPVLLEETAARVVQRAAELPRAMLRQLLLSAKD